MIKKTINYTDHNGKSRTEDHYFNLSKSELVRLQITAPNGDLTTHIQGLVDNVDRKEVMRHYDEIINMSYGIRTEDGRFEKSPAILARFQSSNAYDTLFMDLFQDGAVMSDFVQGLLPAELRGSFGEQINQKAQENMTPRERSEAQMQGFQKAKEAPKPSTVQQVDDVPVLDTAPAVLDSPPVTQAPVDPTQMTTEQLQALVDSRRNSGEINSDYQSQNFQ